VGLSLSSVGVNSQGTFADGKGQWLGSARRGFLEYVLAVGGVQDDIDPRYWDALGRVQYLVGGRHVVSANVLVAGDAMGWRDDESHSRVDSDWSSAYAWIGWDASLAERLRVKTMLSAGTLDRDRVGSVVNEGQGEFTPLDSEVRDLADFDFYGARQDWQLDLTDDLMVKAGVDARKNLADYDYRSASRRYGLDENGRLAILGDTTTVDVSPRGDELGVYGALRGRAPGGLSWEGGLRYDRQTHTDDATAAPRILLRWDSPAGTVLRGSWGHYDQSHGVHELAVQDGERDFAPTERSELLAFGVEHRFRSGLTARVEAYRRTIRDPRPIWVNLSREVNPILEVESDRHLVDAERSRLRGVEWVVSKDGTGSLSWDASYALAWAEDFLDGRWAPRTLDQRHTVNVRGAWRAGPGWQLSGSWQFHTGWPFTEQTLDMVVTQTADDDQTVEVLDRGFGPYNAERLPAYHRLDVRITRAFDLRRSRLEVFLDVFNLYNRTNLRGYEWSLRPVRAGQYTAFRSSGEEQLPIMPTLGLRWVF